jgi:hypothetical protein
MVYVEQFRRYFATVFDISMGYTFRYEQLWPNLFVFVMDTYYEYV